MINKKYGVLSNYDEDFYSRFGEYCKNITLTKENAKQHLHDFFKKNLSPDISDYVINISGQSSAVPTDVMSFMGDIYNRTVENGIPVDWKNEPNQKFSHMLYYDFGIELFSELFDYLKNRNCRYWLSFRMNDCHNSDAETSCLRSEFFYTAKNNGWMVGEKYGYWKTCLDFSVKQVREYTLSYIKEQLMRYDCYGVEWDFMREPVCFDYLERADCCDIMNGFFRELKATVNLAEEKWKHPIKINVRVGRDIGQNKIFGLDVHTWIKEKLVDSITVTPRFNITDCDMPIAAWKKLVDGTDVELYAGIEILSYGLKMNDSKVVAAYAKKYLYQGADKIYLFNYFYGHNINDEYPDVAECTFAGASAENTEKIDNRFIVTHQDFGPLGCNLYTPLPFKATDGCEFEISTAPYSPNQKIRVFLAADNDINISVNGTPAQPLNDTSDAFVKVPEKEGFHSYKLFENTKMYGFEVNCNASGNAQILKFHCDKKANISYIELYFCKS